MKKWKIFLLLPLLFLSGCREKEIPKPKVVQQIRVACGEEEKHYTQDGKIRRILYCLRRLSMAGYPDCDPERQKGPEVRVELLFSDGSCRVWYQRCGCFVSPGLGRWRQMQEEEHSLRYLFYLMPPDTVAKEEKNCYN